MVTSSSSTANSISRNSIFSNGGLGIDLLGPGEGFTTNVSTKNDGDNPNTQQVDPDSDTGANNLQNKPVLSSARTVSGLTTVKGKLNTGANRQVLVKFYSNPSGNGGKKFMGEKSVTTDATGNASFTFQPASKVALGQTVTATALDVFNRDTSEFSAAKRVTS